MTGKVCQGDILKIERIQQDVLVVSKDFFHSSGEIIGCPVYKSSVEGPLHIYIDTGETQGYVQCEKLALLDLRVRGYKKVDRIALRLRLARYSRQILSVVSISLKEKPVNTDRRGRMM